MSKCNTTPQAGFGSACTATPCEDTVTACNSSPTEFLTVTVWDDPGCDTDNLKRVFNKDECVLHEGYFYWSKEDLNVDRPPSAKWSEPSTKCEMLKPVAEYLDISSTGNAILGVDNAGAAVEAGACLVTCAELEAKQDQLVGSDGNPLPAGTCVPTCAEVPNNGVSYDAATRTLTFADGSTVTVPITGGAGVDGVSTGITVSADGNTLTIPRSNGLPDLTLDTSMFNNANVTAGGGADGVVTGVSLSTDNDTMTLTRSNGLPDLTLNVSALNNANVTGGGGADGVVSGLSLSADGNTITATRTNGLADITLDVSTLNQSSSGTARAELIYENNDPQLNCEYDLPGPGTYWVWYNTGITSSPNQGCSVTPCGPVMFTTNAGMITVLGADSKVISVVTNNLSTSSVRISAANCSCKGSGTTAGITKIIRVN